MAKFRTIYDHVVVASNSGTQMVKDYQSVVDDDGSRHLVVVGEHSLYDEIQSYKESCDLKKIIERFQLTGDVSLLQQKQGFYADVTEYPKTMAEMIQLSDYARDLFAQLSPDDRAIFNNNIEEFLVSMSSQDDKFSKLYNKYNQDPVPEVAESEVTNE